MPTAGQALAHADARRVIAASEAMAKKIGIPSIPWQSMTMAS